MRNLLDKFLEIFYIRKFDLYVENRITGKSFLTNSKNTRLLITLISRCIRIFRWRESDIIKFLVNPYLENSWKFSDLSWRNLTKKFPLLLILKKLNDYWLIKKVLFWYFTLLILGLFVIIFITNIVKKYYGNFFIINTKS